MYLYGGIYDRCVDVRCLKSIHALRVSVNITKTLVSADADEVSLIEFLKPLKMRVQYVGSNGLVSELVPFSSLVDLFSLSNFESGSYKLSYDANNLYLEGTVVLSPGTLMLDDHHFIQVSLVDARENKVAGNVFLYGLEGVNLTDVAYKLNPFYVPKGVRTVSFERGNNFAFGFRNDYCALSQLVLSSQSRSMTLDTSELIAVGEAQSDVAFSLSCLVENEGVFSKVTNAVGNKIPSLKNVSYVCPGQYPIVVIPCKSEVWSNREQQPEIQSFQITLNDDVSVVLYGLERIRL